MNKVKMFVLQWLEMGTKFDEIARHNREIANLRLETDSLRAGIDKLRDEIQQKPGENQTARMPRMTRI